MIAATIRTLLFIAGPNNLLLDLHYRFLLLSVVICIDVVVVVVVDTNDFAVLGEASSWLLACQARAP